MSTYDCSHAERARFLLLGRTGEGGTGGAEGDDLSGGDDGHAHADADGGEQDVRGRQPTREERRVCRRGLFFCGVIAFVGGVRWGGVWRGGGSVVH